MVSSPTASSFNVLRQASKGIAAKKDPNKIEVISNICSPKIINTNDITHKIVIYLNVDGDFNHCENWSLKKKSSAPRTTIADTVIPLSALL